MAVEGRRSSSAAPSACSATTTGTSSTTDLLEDRAAAAADDPLPRLRRLVVSADGGSETAVLRLEEEVAAEIEAALASALAAPFADAATAADHVIAPTGGRTLGAVEHSSTATPMKYGRAVNEALRRELSARPGAVVFGEDIAVPGGVFGVTRNLQREFGPTASSIRRSPRARSWAWQSARPRRASPRSWRSCGRTSCSSRSISSSTRPRTSGTCTEASGALHSWFAASRG